MSHFFAYLSRMKLIQRWGLMRNIHTENIQEHSLQVAFVAHGLAMINNQVFAGSVNPERIATLAMFHDTSEIITGDLATPIKYFNPEIKQSFKEIELVANKKLHSMIPQPLQAAYRPYFFNEPADEAHWQFVKAADKICAFLKCVEEIKMGNSEFIEAKNSIEAEIRQFEMPEVAYFMETYVDSFHLTLDELQ